VIVIDEHVAFFSRGGRQLPDEELALPASRHWRLLQALTTRERQLSADPRTAIRG
jgi:hypothetical protein